MKRMTTTKQISDVLSNNLLQVTKAEVYYKTSRKTDIITDSFLENLQFLCESGCFLNCVGWHYEKDYKTNDYICECSRMNGDSDVIIMVQLKVNDSVSADDVEKMLVIEELEE